MALDPDEFVRESRKLVEKLSYQQLSDDSRKLFEKLKARPLVSSRQSSKLVQSLLEMAETRTATNDNDPYGDGDQSKAPSEPQAQILRELWAMGGDLEHFMNEPTSLPLFARACIQGDKATVTRQLEKTKQGSQERNEILEGRHTSLRLSPLILTVASSKHPPIVQMYFGTPTNKQDHVGVVHVLLRYGARPEAKDAAGKTVVHYGAGGWATANTLAMADACIHAYMSSASFGKQVILKELQNEKFNGSKGILGGFDAKTRRCIVHLSHEDRELSLKPETIFLDSEEDVCILNKKRRLTDIMDRVGTISLHEVVMSTRDDVASFLVEKHDTSLDVGDITPRNMALNFAVAGASVNEIIKKHAIRKSRKEQKQEGKKGKPCFGCNLPFDKLSTCTKCRYALYCSRDCQVADWPSHKAHCKVLSKGIKIGLDDVVDFGTSRGFAPANGKTMITVKHKDRFTRPKNVTIDEWFWIKAQSNGLGTVMLIYDETRSCFFEIKPGGEAHSKLVEEATKQEAVMGRKVHVQARFDAEGNCFAYPHTACLKMW